VCNCTSKNPTVQSFDRTVAPDARVLVARADGGKWRFFITSSQLALVTIEQKGTLGNFPSKQRYIAPNSAIELQGGDAVNIYVQNLSDSEDAKVSTWNGGYLCSGLEPVVYSENGLTIPSGGAWGDIGTNGGYPQPYTNALRIYATVQIRVQAIDQNGNTVLLSGQQPVDERILIDLDAPQNLQFQIRENTPAGGSDFQAVWFRR
jgi:hypothetical protein